MHKIKKMVSYLSADGNDKISKSLTAEPLGFLNAILPLKLKFRSESFILLDNNEILGLITIIPTRGNPYKINITRLIFKENNYDVGKKLIEYVVNKIGAKGANSFSVLVDECHEELFDLFVNGCGFRQCSSEILWKNDKPVFEKSDLIWRYAQKTDSKKIAQLYNDEVVSMYRPSLLRNPKEFEAPLFDGFTDFYKVRYLNEECGKILGYYSITTFDNVNYILDITTNSGYEFDYDGIVNKMLCEIAKKKHAFYPFIKQKKYIKNSEKIENYLKSKNYQPVQTSHILVKDFYKPIKEEASDWKVFLLGETTISG